MQIIRPYNVLDANLTFSNLPETPPALYSAATAYNLGDTVAVSAGGNAFDVYVSVYDPYGPELLINPDHLTNALGWSGNQATVSSVGGKLRATSTVASGGFSAAWQEVSVVSGKTYRATVKSLLVNQNFNVYDVAPSSFGIGGTYVSGDGSDATVLFVAPDSNVSLNLFFTSTGIGSFQDFGDVSLKEVLPQNMGNSPTAPNSTYWRLVSRTYGAYSAGSTYAVGDIVADPTGHRLYESLQASNTGNALSNPLFWLDVGPTNRWAMFDQITGTRTIGSGSIVTELTIPTRVDSLALLDVEGATVDVVAETATGTEVYNETYSLSDNEAVADWYDYFFVEITKRTELIVTDLPRYAGMTVRVTINAVGSVALSSLVIGSARDLGVTLYGARVGIIDYSRKEADDFGNYALVERAFSKRGNFTVMVEGVDMESVANKVDAVHKLLASYRASPLVWVGSQSYGATAIFGFYRAFEVDIAYPTHSMLSLEIEGLT